MAVLPWTGEGLILTEFPVLSSGEDTARRPPSKRVRNLMIGALITLTLLGWAGDLLLGTLIDTHPLLFIAMNARSRNLVLASPALDAWSYYAVGFTRLVVSDPLFFLLGRWYGDAAVTWMERKSPTYGGMVRSAERWFGKAAYPLVAFAPNNFICLFAGASNMNPIGFIVCNVVGTIIRLIVLRAAGDIFSDPIDSITDFIADNRILITAVSAVVLIATIWNDRRHGGTEVEDLAHFDEEIERTEHEREHD